jgi:tetratricopeptide (TPR) repeat protein
MTFRTLAAFFPLVCLAAGLSGCSMMHFSSSPEPAKDVVATGNAAYDRKDYAAACRDLSQAGPSAGAAVLTRAGDACFRDGRQKALAAFQAAAKASPDDAAALEGLGLAALADGDVSQARSMLEAAAKAGGKDPRAALALGDASLLSGQCDQALAAYREAVRRDASLGAAKSRLEAARLVCGARRTSSAAPASTSAPAATRSAPRTGSDLSPAPAPASGSAKEPGKAKAAPKVIDLNDI